MHLPNISMHAYTSWSIGKPLSYAKRVSVECVCVCVCMRVYKAHNLNFSPFVPLLFAVKLESRKSTVGPAGWLAGRPPSRPPSSPRVVRGNSWREAGKFSEERWRHASRRRTNYCRFDLSLPPYHHSSSIRRLPFPFFLHLFVTVPWRHFAKERERKRDRENYFVYLYLYIYR